MIIKWNALSRCSIALYGNAMRHRWDSTRDCSDGKHVSDVEGTMLPFFIRKRARNRRQRMGESVEQIVYRNSRPGTEEFEAVSNRKKTRHCQT